MYANKKINLKGNLAQQTAQIIANVTALEDKQLIRLSEDTVYLYPQIWKDKSTALNWISCLHHYFCVKRKLVPSSTLYFKHLETGELIGAMSNKKPKVLLFS